MDGSVLPAMRINALPPRRRCPGPLLILPLAASLLSGCGFLLAQNETPVVREPPACLRPPSEKPWTVSLFVQFGDQSRDTAIESESDRLMGALSGLQLAPEPWIKPLADARDCYKRALRLSPDNYAATLGLGVVYLTVAQRVGGRSSVRPSLLSAAKNHLGRAYLIRKGAMEPQYYLAMVAIAENQLPVASYFLDQMIKAGFREGESQALLGYVAELQRAPDRAAQHYGLALQVGAPSGMLRFVESRIQSRQLKAFFPQGGRAP